MKIVAKATWASMDAFISGKAPDKEESFEYSGPTARLDRAAQKSAKALVQDTGATADALGGAATNERSQLTPFYTSELNATHGFTPDQTNELLTAAGAGTGAAAGAAQSQLDQQAALTRNPSGFTKSLQEMARDRMKAAAGTSEGVAAQDVAGAQLKNQEGASGLSGLYGENLKGQLGAMGLEDKAINTQIDAGKSGWLQNMTGVMDSIAKVGSAAFPKGVQG